MSIRKITKYAFILLVLVSFSTNLYAQAQKTLSIPNREGVPGSKVEVSVNLSDGANVTALQLDVGFPSSLVSLEDAKKGSLLKASHSITKNVLSDKVRVIAFSPSNESLKSGPGSIVVFTFLVKSGAQIGKSGSLTLSDVVLSDPGAKRIEVEFQNGIFSVKGTSTKPPTAPAPAPAPLPIPSPEPTPPPAFPPEPLPVEEEMPSIPKAGLTTIYYLFLLGGIVALVFLLLIFFYLRQRKP